MKIERIEPSTHKKGRILVFLEDGACLRITEREALNFSLHAGEELDADTLARLKEAAGISNLRAKAAELVSKQAMSRRTLVRKLTDRGAAPSEAEQTADWMVGLGALNDRDYAVSLARACAAKGYGPARIRAKLYEKGVPRELWEEAMTDLPDDSAQIDAYLQRKLLGARPDEREKRRLTSSLLRRGFQWDAIRAAWGRYGEELEEE